MRVGLPRRRPGRGLASSPSTISNLVVTLSSSSIRPGKSLVSARPLSVAAGSTVTVTVGGAAADALASGAGSPKLGLGPLASVAVAGASSERATTNVLATREGRLVVCHKASGVAQPLSISESAREGHLGHGDTLGACAASAGR